MGCFSCFDTVDEDKTETKSSKSVEKSKVVANSTGKKKVSLSDESSKSAKKFSYRELAIATQNFNEVNLIGEGGFGNVYKGRLSTGQVVAVKKLNQEGIQGSQEFLVEVLMLSMFKHPNLVTLVGYCAEGDERLLVYEYMVKGSLEDHLFDFSPDQPPLDWNTRIKIAVGAAKGLTYLHDVANPPVIYRDMKAANVLLDNDFNPKLSDFGLAKLGPVGANTHVSTRVMGTYGYCAPDYAMSGKLTLKSDIYSFGILLLELITGRRAFDSSKVGEEQRLTTWSRPFLNDRRKYRKLADPTLQGRFPPRAFHQLVVIILMCLQEQAQFRPFIADVVIALNHVANLQFGPEPEPNLMSLPPPSPSSSKQVSGNNRGAHNSPKDYRNINTSLRAMG